VYPPSLLNTVVIFPQTLQVLWLSAAFYFLVSGLRAGSRGRCAAAAALWGGACLTRAGNAFFFPAIILAPLLAWRALPSRSWRWRVGTAATMVAVGLASVAWWNGRDFPKTFRLEYLLLEPTERYAAATLLRPIEPLHEWIAVRLRSRFSPTPVTAAGPGERPAIAGVAGPGTSVRSAAATQVVGGTADVKPAPTIPSSEVAKARRNARSVEGALAMESQRWPLKLWETFRSPDGLVQMKCLGPEGGYWNWFSQAFADRPIRAVVGAVNQPCLAIKSVSYLWHYATMVLGIVGIVYLAIRLPDIAMLFVGYVLYTLVVIILGSNYGNGLAAVPRFAFSMTPLLTLVAGLVVARLIDRRRRTADAPIQHV
jgi:hypothetical protein